ncbi:MAG: hypothetical protein KatS3mg110_3958 [Pirellulaceae bacterium]|nr:MAG: hypothetical protein KatS3mg110_3958 [Pirellulaceae bacterium]
MVWGGFETARLAYGKRGGQQWLVLGWTVGVLGEFGIRVDGWIGGGAGGGGALRRVVLIILVWERFWGGALGDGGGVIEHYHEQQTHVWLK